MFSANQGVKSSASLGQASRRSTRSILARLGVVIPLPLSQQTWQEETASADRKQPHRPNRGGGNKGLPGFAGYYPLSLDATPPAEFDSPRAEPGYPHGFLVWYSEFRSSTNKMLRNPERAGRKMRRPTVHRSLSFTSGTNNTIGAPPFRGRASFRTVPATPSGTSTGSGARAAGSCAGRGWCRRPRQHRCRRGSRRRCRGER